MTYLNHGSFGACPREILAEQGALRDRMEAEPTRFLTREAPALLREARHTLGRFLGAPPSGLAFVPSITHAINAVLRSVPIPAGSELLVTDHAYNATRNVVEYVAAERGARVVVAQVPFPLADAGEVVEGVLAAVTPRTRLAVIEHVTSQTAVVFPLEELLPQLEARGVDVLVDGAHAPGMLDLDVAALSPAWYAGNGHKWLCAPKGVGFLWAREDRREQVRPAVISHGANAPVPLAQRFRSEFDWMGTWDPTPALCLPAVLRLLEGLLPGGFPALRARDHELALAGRARVAEALGVELPCPDACIGSMASLPVPESVGTGGGRAGSALDENPLHDRLLHEHGVEVPVLSCPAHPGRLLRISAAPYNEPEDYERLAAALRSLA